MKRYEFKNPRSFFYVLFLSLSMLFFVMQYFSVQLSIVERVVGAVLFPVVKLQNIIVQPVQAYFKNKINLDFLSLQVEQLQGQNQNLLEENIKLKASLDYMSATNELDKFRKRYSDYVCTGQIILRQISEQGQYIFIDQGLSSSVEQDMIAVYKNSLVGRVDKVYDNYSRIVLVTDNLCKISAYCYSKKLKGIYVGKGALDFAELMHIDHLQSPQIDDLVLSSGEGLIYPAGFALGRISEMSSDGVNYKILVTPLYNLSQLNYCCLIKSKSSR